MRASQKEVIPFWRQIPCHLRIRHRDQISHLMRLEQMREHLERRTQKLRKELSEAQGFEVK